MNFDIVTLFPEMFDILDTSILKKAHEKGAINYQIHNPRDFSLRKHAKVDDYAFGGSEGMVIQCQPMFDCIKSIENWENKKIIYFSPKGKVLNQTLVEDYATANDDYILVNGHYEGIDQRVLDYFKMEEVSIGDYVLSGGEYASIIFIDAITRLQPNVLQNQMSHVNDSISSGLLEGPIYTRPADYEGMQVPEVLLSGHHANIDAWNLEQSLNLTKNRRPDLYQKYIDKKEK